MAGGRRMRRLMAAINVPTRRLPWLAIFAAVVTCWPAVGTAVADGPAISGLPQVGNTLSLSNIASLGGDPTTYTYQWADCDTSGANCVPVANHGTASSYTLQASDVGKTIEATISVPGPLATTTAGIGPVVPSPWVATVAPAITGTPQQGQTLSTSNGTWGTNPTTTTYTYQWQDCDASGQTCSPVATSGTSSSYTLQASDVGHTIVATVSATDAYGDVSAPSSSASRGPVVSDATTTALVASPGSAQANQTVTLIATVSSKAGAPAPAGALTFENRKTAIGGCANLPVQPTGQSVTVFCSTSFGTSTGNLTAVFVPGTGSTLQGSTSPAVAVSISASASDPTPTPSPPSTGTGTVSVVEAPLPASHDPISQGVVATIRSTMQWTFHYTPSYTQIRALVVNGVPARATVIVKCHGGGCPFAHRRLVLARMRRCGPKTSGMCLTHGSFNLTPGFATRRLAVGTQITIVIGRAQWIGKYYAFTVRARRAPRISISCLAPGATKPGQGC
jgi:hypothetical protein